MSKVNERNTYMEQLIEDNFGRTNNARKYTTKEWRDYLDRIQNTDMTSDDYKTIFLKDMKKYADEHADILIDCYKWYQEATSDAFIQEHYVSINERMIKKILSRCKVMVLTANPIEKAIFHYLIILRDKKEKIRKIICENTVFFVLKWGSYWVAHVHQAETGSYKNMGSSATIHDALKLFTPNVIISLGVAFGIDIKTQSIGDVIVSKRILPYNENKRGEDYIKPDRGQDKTIDKWLHVRLINSNGFMDSVTYGDILSGGSVLSSFDEKDKICSGYTKSDYIVGGEMEGSGLFQCVDTEGIPGVVIKGICDWGVAKNDIYDDPNTDSVLKDSLQAYAMKCAVEKCSKLLADPELFSVRKDANVTFLQKQRNVYRRCLLIVCFVLLVIGVCGLIGKYRIYSAPFFQLVFESSPFLFVCIGYIVLFVYYLYSLSANRGYNPDGELKYAKPIVPALNEESIDNTMSKE